MIDGNCADVNECESNPCEQNSSCDNFDGGYTCSCDKGFSSVDGLCEDIDECSTDNNRLGRNLHDNKHLFRNKIFH